MWPPTLGDGQIRHLAWIDDRRVVFEDGGAAARWQMHEIGVGTRPLWPTADARRDPGATDGVTLAANCAAPGRASAPTAQWVAGHRRRPRGPGALARAPRRPGAVADGDHHGPALVAGVGVDHRDGAACSRQPEGGRCRFRAARRRWSRRPRSHRRPDRVLARRRRHLRAGSQRPRVRRSVARSIAPPGGRAHDVHRARQLRSLGGQRRHASSTRRRSTARILGGVADGAVRPLTTFQSETPWWHPDRAARVDDLSAPGGGRSTTRNYPDIAQEVGVIDVTAAHAGRPAQRR